MTEPVTFDQATARFGLPLIFAAQAQKEFFVNEALARLDAAIHCVVEVEVSDPPASPVDGRNWLVGVNPTDVFMGREGAIACRQAGQWLFVQPVEAMRIYDRALGQSRFYFDGWTSPAAPIPPGGGSTIDAEARLAIEEIVAILRYAALIPTS